MYFEVCVCYCSPHSARDDCFEMKLSVAPNLISQRRTQSTQFNTKKTHDKNKTKQINNFTMELKEQLDLGFQQKNLPKNLSVKISNINWEILPPPTTKFHFASIFI